MSSHRSLVLATVGDGRRAGFVREASDSWLWLRSWSQGCETKPLWGSLLRTESTWDSLPFLLPPCRKWPAEVEWSALTVRELREPDCTTVEGPKDTPTRGVQEERVWTGGTSGISKN